MREKQRRFSLQFTVRMPKELKEKVDSEMDKRGEKSFSALVRRLLQKWLDGSIR